MQLCKRESGRTGGLRAPGKGLGGGTVGGLRCGLGVMSCAEVRPLGEAPAGLEVSMAFGGMCARRVRTALPTARYSD